MEDYEPIFLNDGIWETKLVISFADSGNWAEVDKGNNVVLLDLAAAKRVTLDASADPMVRGIAALILYAHGLGQKMANEKAARVVDYVLKEGGGTYGDIIREQLERDPEVPTQQ